MKTYIKIVLSTTALFLTQLSMSFAQNEANIWYMGNGAGLNFNTNPPSQMEDGNTGLLTFTGEGVGSISDASGTLQFYTNGSTIYDRTHTAMPLGTGLNGNGTTTQTGLIIPVNGSSSQYFVISTSDGNAVKYVLVDMTLAGNGTVIAPQGDVVLASKGGGNGTTLLAGPIAEGTLAIPVYTAGNVPTGEYWVIFHGVNDAIYHVFKTNGPALTFQASYTVGFVVPGQPVMIMKTNSCFDKIANSFYNAGRVEILPFNNVTGVISAPTVTLAGTGAGNPFLAAEVYGVEFSPNGRFLYVTESGLNGKKTVYQFDLNAGTPAAIIASRVYFTGDGSVSRFGALQLGPDGKIYVPGYNTTAPCYLSVITNPDVKWTATTPAVAAAGEFDYLKYTYTIKRVGEGLPPVLKNLLTSIRIFYNNACEGGTTNFSYVFGGAATSVSWDFGDPASGAANTSTSPAPSHTYATAGTYTVTLTLIDNCGRTRTGTVNVIVKTGPVVSVPANLCANTNITLTGTGPNAANYTWSMNSDMSSPAGPSSSYLYNGALPATVYVQDPTPLATYVAGNSTAAANAGADVGHTYFELFTKVTITSFQVVSRVTSGTANISIQNEAGTTTYWGPTACSPTASGQVLTFSPNIELNAGRYRFFTSNVSILFRNNTDDDGNRDVNGVLDVLGEKNGSKGGSFINITVALPDPCGIKAIVLAPNCPLPVSLLEFYGEPAGSENLLFWKTSEEVNNDYFLVQRSSDGIHFQTIGSVDGHGTTNSLHHYSFIDVSPDAGINYYRLVQTDSDGKIQYTEIIVLNSGTLQVSVQPNPFSDHIKVFIPYREALDLEVLDITGKTVAVAHKESGQHNVVLGDELAAGTYVLHVILPQRVVTIRIIKV